MFDGKKDRDGKKRRGVYSRIDTSRAGGYKLGTRDGSAARSSTSTLPEANASYPSNGFQVEQCSCRSNRNSGQDGIAADRKTARPPKANSNRKARIPSDEPKSSLDMMFFPLRQFYR